MKIKLLSLILFATSFTNVSAQSETPKIFTDLFNSIHKDDKIEFINCFLSSGEYIDIVSSFLAGQDKITPSPSTNINSVDYMNYLKDSVLQGLKNKAASFKIDLRKCQYTNCKYQVFKDPQILLASLTGTLYLKYDQSYLSLEISEAVLVHDQWKISKMGALTLLDDSSVITNNIKKISAFNSIETQNKIIDIKLTEIKTDPDRYPPPPPPPPPPPKHSSRKKN